MKNIISWHPPIFWLTMSSISPNEQTDETHTRIGLSIMSYHGQGEECSYSHDVRVADKDEDPWAIWYSDSGIDG